MAIRHDDLTVPTVFTLEHTSTVLYLQSRQDASVAVCLILASRTQAVFQCFFKLLASSFEFKPNPIALAH